MKISYKWLQSYFDKPLPSAEAIAELFTFHEFEVEGIEDSHDDKVLDVKVLPDRASYCLSHEGIARELSYLIDIPFTARRKKFVEEISDLKKIEVSIADTNFCDRYTVAEVVCSDSFELPETIKERLLAVGSRLIHPLVDLANFVMLDIGQPMHVFNREKVEGNLSVRYGKEGERITTLDNKDVALDLSIGIIADDNSPLAIAGIKGGKKAEVDNHAKHILIESAHFNASQVRKTSQKVKIQNDSSKRFENSVSSEKTIDAINYFLYLLNEFAPTSQVVGFADYNNTQIKESDIECNISFIQKALGAEIPADEIVALLKKEHLLVEKNGSTLKVRIPTDRTDLVIKEDLVEEVGRLYGYEKINGILPDTKKLYKNNSRGNWIRSIKQFFADKGFSEIYSYTFTSKGERKVVSPLADDKAYLRTNLSDAMVEKLALNIYYADLVGMQKSKLFEIGTVFGKENEHTSLCVGIAYKKAKKGERVNDEIKEIRDALVEILPANIQTVCTVDDTGGLLLLEGKQIGVINNRDGIMELDLDEILKLLPEKEEFDLSYENKNVSYKPLSQYPFSSRDVAVFVSGKGKEEEVLKVIKQYAGDLLVRVDLFDVFTKTDKETNEERTSYAYRLVFQSFSKTLSDEEVNECMTRITEALQKNDGWQVR